MSATPLAIAPQSNDASHGIETAPPFVGLPHKVIAAIADIAEERTCRAGEALFTPGQYDGAEFFFIGEGRLKAAYADHDSGAMLIEEFSAGGFFGLADAVAGGEDPRAEGLTLTAEEDTRLVGIDAEAFRGVIAQRPTLTRNLMQYFAEMLASASFQSAPEEFAPERRVFSELLKYVERDAVTGDWRIERMPKHRELAEKAGSEETVAAGAVARLIQDGVARRDYPGLVIADITRLSQLAS